MADQNLNLVHHFLIAMPSMDDPVFSGSVIYVCEHNADGALGVIINKPTDMTMAGLFERIELKLEIAPENAVRPPVADLPHASMPIMFGGPVHVDRGFVLHRPREQFSSMLKINQEVAMTTSKDILEALANGTGPSQILVSLGCSGWGAGQLEQEILRNGWLTVPAATSVIFDLPVEERFNGAFKLLGIDPALLSGEAGHA